MSAYLCKKCSAPYLWRFGEPVKGCQCEETTTVSNAHKYAELAKKMQELRAELVFPGGSFCVDEKGGLFFQKTGGTLSYHEVLDLIAWLRKTFE